MNLLRRVVFLVAAYAVKSEWSILRGQLLTVYKAHLEERNCRPAPILACLLISGEDHRFFHHAGFDLRAICRAIYRHVFWGIQEGASTIEQQTVRILTGRYEKTIERKVREILLATLVTEVIPKTILPSIHLEIAYFGWRMNNFRQACKRLELHPQRISLEDAAAVVARLKYPEPRTAPLKRRCQIQHRKVHLMKLYRSHLKQGVYNPLEGTADENENVQCLTIIKSAHEPLSAAE
jgi:membrane carboxypeptidase/penicillin-binding protein PbpC